MLWRPRIHALLRRVYLAVSRGGLLLIGNVRPYSPWIRTFRLESASVVQIQVSRTLPLAATDRPIVPPVQQPLLCPRAPVLPPLSIRAPAEPVGRKGYVYSTTVVPPTATTAPPVQAPVPVSTPLPTLRMYSSYSTNTPLLTLRILLFLLCEYTSSYSANVLFLF